MKKDRQQDKPLKLKKLSVRRESVGRLDPEALKPVAGGACATRYCRSGWSCVCSSG
jgi:hypothetical protein